MPMGSARSLARGTRTAMPEHDALSTTPTLLAWQMSVRPVPGRHWQLNMATMNMNTRVNNNNNKRSHTHQCITNVGTGTVGTGTVGTGTVGTGTVRLLIEPTGRYICSISGVEHTSN